MKTGTTALKATPEPKKKILHLECHSILSYDQLTLWTELGYDCLSLGSYINPAQPHDPKRPAIAGMAYHEELAECVTGESKEYLPEELIDWADIIIIDHIPRWVSQNWDRMQGKQVVWRSIGQSTPDVENVLDIYRDDLWVVRYSPKEQNIPGYVGHDAIIRFHKDENELHGWTGTERYVVTVAQAMKQRGPFCHFDVFDRATRGLPRKLFGPNNESAGDLWYGCPTWDELKWVYRDHRVFFYTGTAPASYTLGFIEAAVSGIPIVAIGPRIAQSALGLNTYEAHEWVERWSNDEKNLAEHVRILLDDYDLCREISARQRAWAIELFGKQKALEAWGEFLNRLS